MRVPRRRSGVVLAAVAVLVGPTLVGCEGSSDDEASGSTAVVPPTVEDVLEAAVPIPDDLRESGFELTAEELTEKELPADFPVEQLPPESPPDPCDASGQEPLAGAPDWSDGRAAKVVLERAPLPSVGLVHLAWRYESPEEAQEVLAVAAARVAACPSTVETGSLVESFAVQGEQFPEVAEYSWDISVGPAQQRRRFGWSQRLNDVVLVELVTVGSVETLRTRDVLSQVSGRVLNAEVDFQRYGTDDEDA